MRILAFPLKSSFGDAIQHFLLIVLSISPKVRIVGTMTWHSQWLSFSFFCNDKNQRHTYPWCSSAIRRLFVSI